MTLQRSRSPFMAMGMLSLLAALWGGILRLGWDAPVPTLTLSAFHGPLMVSGFLGTVIGMERAVAMGERWTYAGPLLTGVGALVLIAGLPWPMGPLFMVLGSLILSAIFIVIFYRQPALFNATMGIGAFCWCIGNALWLRGWPVQRVALWWAGFLILTIAGERLELARLMRVTRWGRVLYLFAIGLLLAGSVWSTGGGEGVRLTGAGMVALAVWLARNDIARRTVRTPGLTRFIAVCLLSGYVWLLTGGLIAVFSDTVGSHYDALLHTVFLGFVFAMIFGHAPIIFPAVMGVSIPFRSAFYVHLILLHVTMILRVAGDLGGWRAAYQWGGLLNVLTLLIFLANTVCAALSSPPESGPATAVRGGR